MQRVLPLVAITMALPFVACGDDGDATTSAGADGGAGSTTSASSGSGGSTSSGEACDMPAEAPVDASPPGTWSTLAPLAAGPRQETGVAALDGKVYVLGGFTLADIVPSVEIYDPALDTWAAGPDLPQAMHHANVVAVGASLFVLGFLEGGAFTARGTTYELDTTSGLWEERSPMPPNTERGASAIAVIGTRVIVAGGFRGGAVDDASVYDTETDSWSALPPLPEARDHGVGAVANGAFFALGGRGGDIGAISGAVYAFDDATQAWCERAPMPTPRGGTAAAVIGGKVIVVGGEGNARDPDGVFSEVEAFDPVANRWEILTPLSAGRHGTGAAAVGDVLYFPGGADQQAFGAVATVEALRLR